MLRAARGSTVPFGLQEDEQSPYAQIKCKAQQRRAGLEQCQAQQALW